MAQENARVLLKAAPYHTATISLTIEGRFRLEGYPTILANLGSALQQAGILGYEVAIITDYQGRMTFHWLD